MVMMMAVILGVIPAVPVAGVLAVIIPGVLVSTVPGLLGPVPRGLVHAQMKPDTVSRADQDEEQRGQ